jgi:L-threonylcarbamoyladenylate synthase
MPRIFQSVSDPEVAVLLQQGAIGVLPTDTVYGLVAQASNEPAIKRLYGVKDRPLHAGTMIGASINQFETLGFPYEPLARANHYWPAPLSVVVDARAVAQYLKAEREALPVRIPRSEPLLALLDTTGPLMTTSANHPQEPTATTMQQAVDYFGDDVDFYVDAGDLGKRPPSTIIEFATDGTMMIRRDGAIKISPDASAS